MPKFSWKINWKRYIYIYEDLNFYRAIVQIPSLPVFTLYLNNSLNCSMILLLSSPCWFNFRSRHLRNSSGCLKLTTETEEKDEWVICNQYEIIYIFISSSSSNRWSLNKQQYINLSNVIVSFHTPTPPPPPRRWKMEIQYRNDTVIWFGEFSPFVHSYVTTW